MSTAQIGSYIPPSPSSLSAGFRPDMGGGNGTDQSSSSSDSIALSPAAVAGGVIGIAAAAGLIGVGGTLLAKRDGKAAPAGNGGFALPAAPSLAISDPVKLYTSIATENRLRQAPSKGDEDRRPVSALPHYLRGAPPGALVGAFTCGTQRFHPAQSGANCAVDALNMLVNGAPWLRATPCDYELMKAGYGVDGTSPSWSIIGGVNALARKSGAAGFKGTSTVPEDFPAMYRQNIALAKHAITCEMDGTTLPERKRLLKQDLEEIKRFEQCLGTLQHLELNFQDRQGDAACQSALRAFEKRMEQLQYAKVICIASPMKDTVLGALQQHFGFKHHYYTIEQTPKGHWIKRDSGREQNELIRDSNNNNMLVKDACSAIRALMTGLKQPQVAPQDPAANNCENTSTDRTKPIHIFIPGPR